MMLRCLPRVALLGTLLALGFGFQPMGAHAASVNPNASTTTVDYRLTTSSTIAVPGANITGPQVVALVTPPGSVVPPTSSDGTQGSPLTVLPDSTGFDPSKLIVALNDSPSSSGQPEQQLGLVFYGQGFQAGGVLHFALSVNSALASDPPVLESLTPGITIAADSTTAAAMTSGVSGNSSSSSGSSSGGIVNNPEPLSVILWSAVLVGVVARNRMLSRSKAG
ncbi:MAG TPA: hypothetical protein VN648_08875 [Candidatus Methylomirabilis sp.]|nr:hypothetical protein [Candidatus Methylomirabilis sp.]